MESYRELYDSIDNPIENQQLLETFVLNYSRDKNPYESLVSEQEGIQTTNFNKNHKENLMVVLFNYWSYHIRQLPDNHSKILSVENTDMYFYMSGDEKLRLKRLLENIGKVNSYQQLLDVINNNELIERFSPVSNIVKEMYNEWIHIPSFLYSNFDEKKEQIEHRLYVNIEGKNLYQVIYQLFKKINEKNLQFHFKFSETIRDDTLVIYVDKDHLMDYVEIMREIKKEHSELFNDTLKPPVLTGKIDGWLGYGSEPSGEISSSFNSKRAGVIEEGISKEYFSYLRDNPDKKIKYKNKDITINEYFSLLLTKKIIEGFKRDYGVTPSNKNADGIVQQIISQIPRIIDESEKIKWDAYNNEIKIKIQTGNGTIDAPIDNDSIKKVMRSLAHLLYKGDTDLRSKINRGIIISSHKAGIDVRKYCFDVDRRDELFRLDSKKTNEELQAMFIMPNIIQTSSNRVL